MKTTTRRGLFTSLGSVLLGLGGYLAGKQQSQFKIKTPQILETTIAFEGTKEIEYDDNDVLAMYRNLLHTK